MAPRSQISKVVSEPLRRGGATILSRHAETDGFTVVELLVAIVILAVGVLAAITVFDTSKRATRVSERLESQNHVAQRELERVESLPYSQVALTGVPTPVADSANPDYYVGSGTCPNFTWDQSGAHSDQLVINNCSYPGISQAVTAGVVSPTPDTTDYPGYAVYDFVTWVNDSVCGTATGTSCPISYSYKRITIEVCASGGCTSTPAAGTLGQTPLSPVLVSGIVSDPHAAPNVPGLTTSTPLVTCTPLIPASVPCNYGLNGATANVFYMTNSPEGPSATPTGTTTSGSATVSGLSSTSGISVGMYISGPGIPVGSTVSSISGTSITISQTAIATAAGVALTIGPYAPPSADNSCMHYTEAYVPVPFTCGNAGLATNCAHVVTYTTTGCPTPDLLTTSAPPSSIAREYNLSPAPSSVNPPVAADGFNEGRVIKRDPNTLAVSCAVTPSNNATSGEYWATQPLTSALNLNGNGGMTLSTNTLTGTAQSVTLCIGVYKLTPVSGAGNILDPLNALGATDSTLLGTVSYTNNGSWPASETPLAFSFNYMTLSQSVPANTSIGVRIWVTNNSTDDIVVHYDAPNASSGVELDSQ
jgi:prepilin-type N-terminal cleavage/methylation domain-containing protein